MFDLVFHGFLFPIFGLPRISLPHIWSSQDSVLFETYLFQISLLGMPFSRFYSSSDFFFSDSVLNSAGPTSSLESCLLLIFYFFKFQIPFSSSPDSPFFYFKTFPKMDHSMISSTSSSNRLLSYDIMMIQKT